MVLNISFLDTFARGHNIHDCIRSHLDGRSDAVEGVMEGNEGYWESIQPVLQQVENIELQEAWLTHKDLRYKGVLDCVAQFR